MKCSKLNEWQAALGPYGLNLITLKDIASRALASDDPYHMRLAVFFIAMYKYDDGWANHTCTPAEGMKHYHKLIRAIGRKDPLLAIKTCYQAFSLKEGYNHDPLFFDFDTSVIKHVYNFHRQLHGEQAIEAMLFLMSDLDEGGPTSRSPLLPRIMGNLIRKVSQWNIRKAVRLAKHCLTKVEGISELEEPLTRLVRPKRIRSANSNPAPQS